MTYISNIRWSHTKTYGLALLDPFMTNFIIFWFFLTFKSLNKYHIAETEMNRNPPRGEKRKTPIN